MKKKLSFLLVYIITAMMVINSSITAFADETYDNVDLISNYGVVIDYETGQVLGGKNIDAKVYPASTTKIWTAYLVVKNTKNNENGSKFVLPNSLEMINVINDLISNKTYKSAYEFYSDLYNGNYNTYNDPGYYLADADGNVINTTDSDWCITKEKVYSGKNKKKWNNKWKYTYEICKESSIYIAYKNVNSEENIRIVDMVDDDGPVLLADNDNNEFITRKILFR